MRRIRTGFSLAALAALLSSGIACKQGNGDRCELNSDCKSGLVCIPRGSATDPHGGVCGPPTTNPEVDAAVVDTGTGTDVAPETAGNDTSGTEAGGEVGGDVATGDAADATTGSDAADDSGNDATAD